MVTNDLAAFMSECGARAYPNEACGLVIQTDGKKPLLVEIPNRARDPRNHFVMDSEAVQEAKQRGKMIGVWHTHVEISNRPSDADKVGCEVSEVPWYIASVQKHSDGKLAFSEVNVVQPSGFEMPYTERPYVFGVLDCYSLVRDFYRREFGIVMGDYPRIEDWWQRYNFFGENWAKEGFVRLEPGTEPLYGDTFLLQIGGDFPNHVAIYVGHDKILHHNHGRLSKHDIYGGYWHKHTVAHLRHQSKC